MEAKLKNCQDEMIKVSKEKADYEQKFDYIHHQTNETIVEYDHYKQRMKVLEEEIIKLQDENQRLQNEKRVDRETWYPQACTFFTFET